MSDLTPIELLVLAFASYRITRFFVLDSVLGYYPGEVPGDPEKRGTFVRAWLDRLLYDENGHDLGPIRGWVGSLLSCSWCFGVWVSVAVWWAYTQSGWGWVDEAVVIAAIAGGQGYLASRMNA